MNKSIERTSKMLRLLEDDHTSSSLKEPRQINQTILEEEVKALLFILAKVSHHKSFKAKHLPETLMPLGRKTQCHNYYTIQPRKLRENGEMR